MRHPERVECRPDRIPDVGHPEKVEWWPGQDSRCETFGEGNGGRTEISPEWNDGGAGVPDVRHPEKVKWRSGRILDVRHPEKEMAAGQKSLPSE